jgi:hypothetical protein
MWARIKRVRGEYERIAGERGSAQPDRGAAEIISEILGAHLMLALHCVKQ